MRMMTLSLAAAFLLGLGISTAQAGGDCGWGHTKTAESSTPIIAEGSTPQTPKPDEGS